MWFSEIEILGDLDLNDFDGAMGTKANCSGLWKNGK